MTEMWDVEEAGAVAEAVFGMQMTFEVAFTSPVPGASAPVLVPVASAPVPVPGASAPVLVSVASAPVNNAALTTPKRRTKRRRHLIAISIGKRVYVAIKDAGLCRRDTRRSC